MQRPGHWPALHPQAGHVLLRGRVTWCYVGGPLCSHLKQNTPPNHQTPLFKASEFNSLFENRWLRSLWASLARNWVRITEILSLWSGDGFLVTNQRNLLEEKGPCEEGVDLPLPLWALGLGPEGALLWLFILQNMVQCQETIGKAHSY